MKNCNNCGELKPLEEYHRHPHNVDGRVNKCKTCSKEYTKLYNQLPHVKKKNKERIASISKERIRKQKTFDLKYPPLLPPPKKIWSIPAGVMKCSICGENKTYNNYYRRPKTKKGFYSRCKSCVSKYNKERKNNE